MTPLVLLHGMTGTPAAWDGVAAWLEGRPLWRPALLGHAPDAGDPSVEHFEHEVTRLAALVPEPAHWVGYSLGARLVMGMLALCPDRVQSATLIASHPGLDDPLARAERRAADRAWRDCLLAGDLQRFVRDWEAQPLFATQRSLPAAALAEQRAQRLSHDPRALARAFEVLGLGAMPSFRVALGRTSAPLTLLVGARDEKFFALYRELAPSLARARLEVVADAGHNLPLERPEHVARAITQGAMS